MNDIKTRRIKLPHVQRNFTENVCNLRRKDTNTFARYYKGFNLQFSQDFKKVEYLMD